MAIDEEAYDLLKRCDAFMRNYAIDTSQEDSLRCRICGATDRRSGMYTGIQHKDDCLFCALGAFLDKLASES